MGSDPVTSPGPADDATFADLGIPFPLFEGPVRDAADFAADAGCSLCGNGGPAFRLGAGANLIVPCPGCGAPAALKANRGADGRCDACDAAVPFPTPLAESSGDPTACYACLRGGRAAITHDTTHGMVRWEDARAGLTHGPPGTPLDGVEVVPGEGDGWSRVRVPREELEELVRTPGYCSWQGEQWRFHCGRPAVFLGSWSRDRLDREAADGDGRALLERLLTEPHDDADRLWDALGDGPSIYVFRCRDCGERVAQTDCD